jgi:hypothetical protein
MKPPRTIGVGAPLSFVMPGPGPGIHVFLRSNKQDVDGRDKPGHDDVGRPALRTGGRDVSFPACKRGREQRART